MTNPSQYNRDRQIRRAMHMILMKVASKPLIWNLKEGRYL